MNFKLVIQFITNWIKSYAKSNSEKSFNLVIGVSGGIDSAVTSTLCANTGILTHVVSMPIKQNPKQHDLSIKHIEWLKSKYKNVEQHIIELDEVFENCEKKMKIYDSKLAFANSRS